MSWIALLRPELELPGGSFDSSAILYEVLDVLLEHSEPVVVVKILGERVRKQPTL